MASQFSVHFSAERSVIFFCSSTPKCLKLKKSAPSVVISGAEGPLVAESLEDQHHFSNNLEKMKTTWDHDQQNRTAFVVDIGF